MKKICILGAGLSATSLINYLLERAESQDWQISLGDFDEKLAQKKINNHPKGNSFKFDVKNPKQVEEVIQTADIVVSMLPANFHGTIAENCVKYKKQMLTASYVSPIIKSLNEEAKAAGIGIYMELGVDPGIDHMSAMRIINKLRNEGAKLQGFYSSTGGLVAPEYDNNPWNYKFTWNPRNVVLAGQGVSMFIRNGRYKYIPYHRLFKRTINTSIAGVGDFEIYPNRDSLKYRETYGLEDIPTIFRGTMRRPGYSKAWDVFVQLGLTDDSYTIEDSIHMNFRHFINTFLPYSQDTSVEKKLQNLFPDVIDSDVMKKLEWLEIFKEIPIPLENASPAQILQYILERKWQLEPGDKDMIAMQHRFEFISKDDVKKEIISSLVVRGKSKELTAMAITVGTPLAIATKMVATGELTLKGVQVPVIPEMYDPILDELATLGINFVEEEKTL